ncbi:hypothetical protein ALC56_00511 [Trachymyrmex septentrionalis]|uniref:Uncharacterized protein n=1 Tax=Trachymyrmex septentrionalis TaxID=34720 RepID=A0A195FXK0_9HYME|nr:hypothetical protein ALC56_00511 [Trachymyrmex septentrionalis]
MISNSLSRKQSVYSRDDEDTTESGNRRIPDDGDRVNRDFEYLAISQGAPYFHETIFSVYETYGVLELVIKIILYIRWIRIHFDMHNHLNCPFPLVPLVLEHPVSQHPISQKKGVIFNLAHKVFYIIYLRGRRDPCHHPGRANFLVSGHDREREGPSPGPKATGPGYSGSLNRFLGPAENHGAGDAMVVLEPKKAHKSDGELRKDPERDLHLVK